MKTKYSDDRAHAYRQRVQHCDLSSFTLSELAATFGVSTSSVQRDLKAAGLNFNELKRNERIRRLNICLAGDEWRGESVAEFIGFIEIGSLYRFIKEKTGKGFKEHQGAKI